MSPKLHAFTMNFGLLLLRVGVGSAFVAHGVGKLAAGPEVWTKLGGAMTNLGVDFLPGVWGFIASLTEMVGGLLLVAGLCTRVAALLLAFVMFVALEMHINSGDSFKGFSHALELLFVFAGVTFTGPGDFSADGLRMRQRCRAAQLAAKSAPTPAPTAVPPAPPSGNVAS